MKLAELQARFGRVLLHGNDNALAGWLRNDGIRPDSLLDIYRDSVFASLTSVLSDTFPTVRRLIGEKRFRQAAEAFVRTFPPMQPCLSEYGERFGEFLAKFGVVRRQPYLPDLARLEWLIHLAEETAESVPLSIRAFHRAVRGDPMGRVVHLDPSIGWMTSQFSVDLIWSARLRKSAIDTAQRNQQCICIEVRRRTGRVVLQRLDTPVYAFRVAVGNGDSLSAAGEAAKTFQPDFAVFLALAELLRSDAVVSVSS